jgi:hypothetical protein
MVYDRQPVTVVCVCVTLTLGLVPLLSSADPLYYSVATLFEEEKKDPKRLRNGGHPFLASGRVSGRGFSSRRRRRRAALQVSDSFSSRTPRTPLGGGGVPPF